MTTWVFAQFNGTSYHRRRYVSKLGGAIPFSIVSPLHLSPFHSSFPSTSFLFHPFAFRPFPPFPFSPFAFPKSDMDLDECCKLYLRVRVGAQAHKIILCILHQEIAAECE